MEIRKVMLLGDIGVGKTSLARRLVLDKFDADYKATIGVDLYKFEVELGAEAAGENGPENGNGARHHGGRRRLELVIWDTDGDFAESIFRHVYVRGASSAMVIGDATRRASQDSMVRLADGFQQAMPGRPFTFVLNKVDLITGDAAIDMPPRLGALGLSLVRTSAKTGYKVRNAFQETAATLLRRNL